MIYYMHKHSYVRYYSMKINYFTNNQAIMEEIGKRIKETRIGFNLTQSELAKKSGVSLSTVARTEQGGNITVEQLLFIMRELRLLDNIDLLIPEKQQSMKDLLQNKPPRKRVKKKQETAEWQWEDE